MFQWFPGHMAKALRQIKEKEKFVDFFIIVLDSRAPISTYNKEFDKISPKKPRLFIINKIDYGDVKKYQKLERYFRTENSDVLFTNLKKQNTRSIIIKSVDKLLFKKTEYDKKRGLLNPFTVGMILGLPNTGKSTLINLLANKSKTKVANTPGVTRGQQLVITERFKLFDTPGILFPKIEYELDAIKIAMIGSIKWEIINQKELFFGSYKLLSEYYPEEIEKLGLQPSFDDNQIFISLEQIGKKHNFYLKDKQIDENRTIIFFNNYVKNLKNVTYDRL
ncbi:ribosome biogenesis GTPase YlqF [[Mycoplasma] mobile]|uniref:Ribosome biogenesis GTPase A n=1 Tax=Mycoplasma mobile (strain ATCC 43663 / 163K / NCTC 11711) TaxID=267748 RepID=Q6KIH1_MYCM1|nr:ribosome biogenesis GTPase YlqF [[Mycoplasma] mobile]AAT27605.1 putative GTP-binding protein [Mycoplasma mobile 163K]